MTENQFPPVVEKKNGLLKALPGIVISLVALAILSYLIDLDLFMQALRLADYRYFPWVVVLFLGTLVTRAFGWRTILQNQVTFPRAFWTMNEGYLFNNILPFRLGELARAFLLNRTNKIPFWEGLSTVMVERIFDIGILAGLLLSTVPFVIGAEWALQAAYIAGVIVLIGFVFLFYLARNPETALTLFERFSKPWPKLTEFGRDKIGSFLTGLGALKEFSKFIKALVWLLLAWGFNIAWYAVLLRAFLPEINILLAAFMVGVVALGVAVPSSPAYVGVFEAATVGALALFNVDENLALAYGVTAHSVYFVITVVLGAIGLARYGQSLGDVYKGIQNRGR